MPVKRLPVIPAAVLFLLYCIACNTGTSTGTNAILTDSVTIAKGEATFNKHCAGCHNFRQDNIGPQLGGLTAKMPADWIRHFIKDPQQLISSGDERAKQLYKKYKVVMPSFASLTGDELNQVCAFINAHKLPDKTTVHTGLANPIPDTIALSNIVVEVRQILQVPASSDSGKLPLARITKLSFQPNTNNLFILDLRGKLYRLQQNIPLVFMDMAKLRPRFINQPGLATGFGSFAFHPQFKKNGLLYTTHTEPPGSAKADFGYADSIKVTLQWVLTEWKMNRPGDSTFSGTGRELLRINMVAGIHGVQEITFNPLAKPGDEDYGLLYIGIGDGGSVEEGFPFLTKHPENIWGSIIRLDPAGTNSANGQYGIPAGNPFAKNVNSKAAKEIYAYGFRNPHRITWTRSGKMLACNVGHGNIESLDLIERGRDYGWPVREGSFLLNPYGDLNSVFPLPKNDTGFHITYPVAAYDHDEGKAISGGFEYSGTAIPKLKGKYLFGDIPTGRLFYVNTADIRQGRQASIKEWKISINGTTKKLRQLCGSDRVDLHFGQGSKGELYILTKADGRVYELTGGK